MLSRSSRSYPDGSLGKRRIVRATREVTNPSFSRTLHSTGSIHLLTCAYPPCPILNRMVGSASASGNGACCPPSERPRRFCRIVPTAEGRPPLHGEVSL